MQYAYRKSLFSQHAEKPVTLDSVHDSPDVLRFVDAITHVNPIAIGMVHKAFVALGLIE